MELLYQWPQYTFYSGDSSEFKGDADLVLTNPYAPLPKQLQDKPMLICDFTDRHKLAEERCGTKLYELSPWYGGRNTIWVGNAPVKNINLRDLNPELKDGWFPLDLPLRLLTQYARPGMTIWDGFMGRGTTGLACRLLGLKFIGIDKDASRVHDAQRYINEPDFGRWEQLVSQTSGS